MVKVVNVHEAKTHLSRLLEEVSAGTEIIVAKAGQPLAKLVPIEPAPKRILGFVPGCVGEEFFAPLPDHEVARWE